MKKLLSLFVALIATSVLWASSVITYTASEKLPEVDWWSAPGLYTKDFNVSITSHTFSNGTGTITFSGDVTSIGDYAFDGCSGLTSITCEAVTPPACDNNVCFEYVDHTIPLYVPAESVEAYKTTEVWKDFTNILPIKPTALDNALAPTDNLRKFMRNGQVLIQRGDMIYNLHGQVVE